METNRSKNEAAKSVNDLGSQKFYHGTKADVKQGNLVIPGFNSNYGKMKKSNYVYLTATLDAIGELNSHRAKAPAEYI